MELVVVVVLGLYVFFHHEGEFKDGGTEEKGQYKICPAGTRTCNRRITPYDYETDALPPELSRPQGFMSFSTMTMISKSRATRKGQYKICPDGTRTYNRRITP